MYISPELLCFHNGVGVFYDSREFSISPGFSSKWSDDIVGVVSDEGFCLCAAHDNSAAGTRHPGLYFSKETVGCSLFVFDGRKSLQTQYAAYATTSLREHDIQDSSVNEAVHPKISLGYGSADWIKFPT